MDKIQQVLRLKKKLDDHRPINPELEKEIWDRFRLDWNYHSNKIEGNSLTYGETKALLLHNITAQGKPLKDHFEITGHNEAVKWVLDIVTGERQLSESFIRELHKMILKEPYETRAITPEGTETSKKVRVGEYKSSNNHVKTRTGEIFRFASVEETPALMNDLINWYRSQSEEGYNPILLATEFHYRFIRIHPFDDGNGRTVRILMNFILMKFGFPPVIIREVQKSSYLSTLEQADAGDIDPFIEFICDRLSESLQLMIDAIKSGQLPDDNDIEKRFKLLNDRINEISEGEKKTRNREDVEFFKTVWLEKLQSQYASAHLQFQKWYNQKIELTVEDKPNAILLRLDFGIFQRKNVEPFRYYCYLKISFVPNVINIDFNYLIEDRYWNEFITEIDYGQKFDQNICEEIVKFTTKEHLGFIERKLEGSV